MGLLDTRCWGCADIGEIDGDHKHIFEAEYQGGGKFRCPNCMEISLDLSENTYNAIIAVDIDGVVSVITPDKRMSEKDINDFTSAIADVNQFKREDAGVYRCEIYWCYYVSGGEEPEWDMNLEFLSMNKIELDEGD